jgi:hypothetical protein
VPDKRLFIINTHQPLGGDGKTLTITLRGGMPDGV